MKVLHCPKCDRAFNVSDEVMASYCNVGHMTAAYREGLPAENGLVYPIGLRAWLKSCCDLCVALDLWITSQIIGKFREHYDAKLSPADAVWLEYGVHL